MRVITVVVMLGLVGHLIGPAAVSFADEERDRRPHHRRDGSPRHATRELPGVELCRCPSRSGSCNALQSAAMPNVLTMPRTVMRTPSARQGALVSGQCYALIADVARG
jgi:hypothetical protein